MNILYKILLISEPKNSVITIHSSNFFSSWSTNNLQKGGQDVRPGLQMHDFTEH